jgi:hypothetical protein
MAQSKRQILPPPSKSRGGRARAVSGARDALFVDIGAGNTAPGGAIGFVAQHLAQEWMQLNPVIDPRRGVSAYRRAAELHDPRSDLLPPV